MLKLKYIIPFAVLLFIGFASWLFGSVESTEHITYSVRRGPLDIKVLEGGNMEALENQELRSQVKGWDGVKILSIVEEGIFITEEDVANKKILVELDSSELKDKLTSSEIEFKGTEASLTTARKGYDIQINQSASDIYAAELEMKFARMEMEKYLDEDVTALVVEAINTSDALNAAEADAQEIEVQPVPESDTESSEEVEETKETEDTTGYVEPENIDLNDLRMGHPVIEFSRFVEEEKLGDGAANQELSKLTSEAYLAQEDHKKAETELEGKLRLHKKKYITDQELSSAQIAVERQKANVDASGKALEIFKNYEFPKQAEQLMSDFIQARRKLDRTEQQALSEIAQAKATLASAEAKYRIEATRIQEYRDQIDVCVMVAEQPGLVVYGGSERSYYDDEPIKAGSTIRERQTIITIPDMSSMAVKVDIHESDIKKVKVGQLATIRVDAYPDRMLEGKVTKVAVLPSSQSSWINPDLKVYETTVRIEGSREWLKPGMSAEVEILVNHLEDILYIPLQSVVPQRGKKVCFVLESGVPVAREIKTSDITVEYITVTDGLSEGEQVLIRPPEGSRDDNEESGDFGDTTTDTLETQSAKSDEHTEASTDANTGD